VVELLISCGVDMDHQDKGGNTALMWATGNGSINSVDWLLGKGADATIRNESGRTALDIAENKGYAEIALMLRSVS